MQNKIKIREQRLAGHAAQQPARKAKARLHGSKPPVTCKIKNQTK